MTSMTSVTTWSDSKTRTWIFCNPGGACAKNSRCSRTVRPDQMTSCWGHTPRTFLGNHMGNRTGLSKSSLETWFLGRYIQIKTRTTCLKTKPFNPMSESFANLLGLTSWPAKSFNFRLYRCINIYIYIYGLTDILIFSNQLVQECFSFQHRGSVLLGLGLYLLLWIVANYPWKTMMRMALMTATNKQRQRQQQ